jgi:hypothetical protein
MLNDWPMHVEFSGPFAALEQREFAKDAFLYAPTGVSYRHFDKDGVERNFTLGCAIRAERKGNGR